MEKAFRFHNPVSKRLLVLISILFALAGIGRLFIAIFNFDPYLDDDDWLHDFIGYKQGILVEVSTGLKIADTSVMTYYKDGRSLVSIPPDPNDERKSIPHKLPMPVKRDSIFAHNTVYTKGGEVDKHVTVKGIWMNRATFYLQTEKLWYRLYFTYPGILNSLVASYCFWLLARFISDIQEGWPFRKSNRLRLQRVGGAVVILQVVYLILETVPPLIKNLDVTYTATIPGYRSHFDFQANPIYPLSITWLLIGALILVLASAFRDGEMLQEDKDLIV